jgi:hypothetical protein
VTRLIRLVVLDADRVADASGTLRTGTSDAVLVVIVADPRTSTLTCAVATAAVERAAAPGRLVMNVWDVLELPVREADPDLDTILAHADAAVPESTADPNTAIPPTCVVSALTDATEAPAKVSVAVRLLDADVDAAADPTSVIDAVRESLDDATKTALASSVTANDASAVADRAAEPVTYTITVVSTDAVAFRSAVPDKVRVNDAVVEAMASRATEPIDDTVALALDVAEASRTDAPASIRVGEAVVENTLDRTASPYVSPDCPSDVSAVPLRTAAPLMREIVLMLLSDAAVRAADPLREIV